MTLNLWGVNKWAERQAAVVQWINEVRPDLLALQEVHRTDGMCQASWIAERTGMTATFGAAHTTDAGEFGNAVLSRLPVHRFQRRGLTDASSGNEPRAIVTVEADASAHLVSFSSTHLSWQFDEGWIREQQVREIADIVAASPYPTIVCGDFNAVPGSTEVQFMTGLRLLDAFEVANPGQPGYTWNNANPFAAVEHEPDRRIDYIFTDAEVLTADVVCDQPRGGAWPSDHFGVAAQLALAEWVS